MTNVRWMKTRGYSYPSPLFCAQLQAAVREISGSSSSSAEHQRLPPRSPSSLFLSRSRLAHSVAAAPDAAPQHAGGSGDGDASSASMRRTRAMAAAEVERISALQELLATDAASIARTRAEHAAYSGEIDEARARITTLKVRACVRACVCMRCTFERFV